LQADARAARDRFRDHARMPPQEPQQRAPDGRLVAAREMDRFSDADTGRRGELLRPLLVERLGGSVGAGSGERDPALLEQLLRRAVFAAGAMQRQDERERPRSRIVERLLQRWPCRCVSRIEFDLERSLVIEQSRAIDDVDRPAGRPEPGIRLLEQRGDVLRRRDRHFPFAGSTAEEDDEFAHARRT